MDLLTTKEAAHRTRRSIRTIRRWRAEGMPVHIRNGRMLIEKTVLLATLRRKTVANPVHKHRAKKLAQQDT